MLHSVNQYLSKNVRLLGLFLAMIFLLGGNSLLNMPKAEDPQFMLPIRIVFSHGLFVGRQFAVEYAQSGRSSIHAAY